MNEAVRVFSDYERTDKRPIALHESHFEFLERIAREEAEHARFTINNWVAAYPKEHMDAWLARFRGKDNEGHQSAFFELFLFTYFRAIGLKIEAVEPEFDGGTPDFLVQNPSGHRLIVEAVSPAFKSAEERNRERIGDEIRDAINSVKAPNHYLVLLDFDLPSEAIQKKPLIKAVSDWLAQNPKPAEKFEYKDRDCRIEIEAIVREGRDVEAPDYRAIGVEVGKGSVSTPGADLKASITRKAAKYRNLPYPYVVAINAGSLLHTEDDFLAALYGSEAVQILFDKNGQVGKPKTIRNANGVFNHGGRPRKIDLSAVAFFNGVRPWNWRNCRGCLIHNAYSVQPATDFKFGGDEYLPEGGKLVKTEGEGAGSIIGG